MYDWNMNRGRAEIRFTLPHTEKCKQKSVGTSVLCADLTWRGATVSWVFSYLVGCRVPWTSKAGFSKGLVTILLPSYLPPTNTHKQPFLPGLNPLHAPMHEVFFLKFNYIYHAVLLASCLSTLQICIRGLFHAVGRGSSLSGVPGVLSRCWHAGPFWLIR